MFWVLGRSLDRAFDSAAEYAPLQNRELRAVNF